MNNVLIDVIIPAYNEEKSIGSVLDAIPKALVREVIVCDNNSNDKTSEVAKSKAATVVFAKEPGYGNACLMGMNHIANKAIKPDIVVFLDGDYSDFPEEMPALIKPIVDDKANLVIGSRATGNLEKGSMMPQQIFGNWLATSLISLIYKYNFTDLGPFRAIDYPSLLKLEMADKNFGWTVEMQVKAAKHKLKCTEVPVSYRKRIGKSKVSGTVKGSVMAGYKILWTIFKNL
jgi:glycosyltransferase involved in cell wall biosynthesis